VLRKKIVELILVSDDDDDDICLVVSDLCKPYVEERL
jgi:hypothetical protein